MSDLLQIELPYPPTLNKYWRRVGNKTLISKKGREFKATVVSMLRRHRAKPLAGPVAVRIWAWVPDHRRRDLDNLFKPLLDSMSGWAYEDDHQIVDLRITKAGKEAGGTLMVQVKPCEPPAMAVQEFRDAIMCG